ncbi:MAG: MoaD/ThiS family protein [Phycisphaeraceae bacterium]|nr:MoaD/ThiS family protein [Phycisphaeraceae bacterium]
MTLLIRLFGPYADAAGARELRLVLPDDRAFTAADVLSAVADKHPDLSPLLPAARLAANNRFAPPSQQVFASDELALIGLVSGG